MIRILALGAVCGFALLVTAPAQVTHQISVTRYEKAGLSDDEAKRILGAASSLLQTNDGPGDVSCNVTLALSGNVDKFTAGNGIIDNADDYAQVRKQRGRVHIVNEINVCGSEMSAPTMRILGCSDHGGNCMVLRRLSSAEEEAVLWAHEFGHNRGLWHRNEKFALMAPAVKACHRRVNDKECAAFSGSKSLLEEETEHTHQDPSDATAENSLSISDFVHQSFIHGVPYAEASAYPVAAALDILPLLKEPTEEPYFSNIILTVCMMGDGDAVEPLIGFFNRDEGRLTTDLYEAKKAVLIGLGYVVNKTGNQQALKFLLESAHPSKWDDRKIAWSAPYDLSAKDLALNLSKISTWSLALTGKKEAELVLTEFRESPTEDPGLKETAGEAKELFDRVQQQGLKSLQ